ncbi:MAG: hypothetical protein AAF726_15900, partial [Planctomycetota bacterium]
MILRSPNPGGLRAALALVLLAVAPLAARGEARDWSEPGGGPLNQSAVAGVEAPRTAPVERWRVPFDALLSEPVVESGFVYAAAQRKKTRRLYAISAETGEEVAAAKLKVGAPLRVSALGSTVVVVGGDGIEVFERRKTRLKRSRTIRGRFGGSATLLPGLAAVAGVGAVRVLDLRTGRDVFSHPGLDVKPVVIERGAGTADLVFTTPNVSRAEPMSLRRVRLTGIGTREPLAGPAEAEFLYPVLSGRSQRPRLVRVDGAGSKGYLVAMDESVKTIDGGALPYFFFPSARGTALPALDRSPVVWRGVVYGWSDAEGLVRQTL